MSDRSRSAVHNGACPRRRKEQPGHGKLFANRTWVFEARHNKEESAGSIHANANPRGAAQLRGRWPLSDDRDKSNFVLLAIENASERRNPLQFSLLDPLGCWYFVLGAAIIAEVRNGDRERSEMKGNQSVSVLLLMFCCRAGRKACLGYGSRGWCCSRASALSTIDGFRDRFWENSQREALATGGPLPEEDHQILGYLIRRAPLCVLWKFRTVFHTKRV